MRLREISLAVQNLSASTGLFSSLLCARPSEVVEVKTPPIEARFVSLDTGGPVSIALMESTQAGSAIERFLERRGEGLFSVTFAVDDIRAAMSRMRAEGVEFVLAEPLVLKNYSTGHAHYRECLVNFTRPRSSGGLLVELQQLTE